MKVVFRPSFDEHVAYVAARQKDVQSSTTKALTWIFFSFNFGVVPAVLLFQGLVWWGLAVFAINVLLWIVMLSQQQNKALREHYDKVWPDLEDHDCECEIDEAGVSYSHAGNFGSYPWHNIKSIRSNDQVIFFDFGPNQVLVSKRAFADKAEMDRFMQLANDLRNKAHASDQ